LLSKNIKINSFPGMFQNLEEAMAAVHTEERGVL
jgi:hypothetical protein